MDALKAAAESCGSTEVNVDYIVNNVIQGGKHAEIVKKIVHYKTKEMAINDCILDLRSNSKLPIEQNMMLIRQLSSKQFKVMIKNRKLINYIQTGSVHGMQQQMY